ncbi:hypothetical protein [Paramaledivibacter caminithermalis]|jgi:uncharacterized protein YoaH (UPF0181 family)|uniref:Uncharacterized protein n=1 Tax=Paramaledivibacter caminithermalis (strain DSM 15212 / CIP 107654 / DViRD3) TaxID=1121301 RepID=A0A1M6TMA4_PARC5|nr:hypothetical protein [Paramaledivibacter caminithermalis]SHK57999.1 hypothetical protein SAMN02745912_03731 [Paramaledivibacter caminithermalis DSM 15212]
MKVRISILLVFVLLLTTGIPAFAADKKNMEANNVFIANDQQIKKMNELMGQGLSTGEVLNIVCPEFFSKLKSKDELYREPFDKDIKNDLLNKPSNEMSIRSADWGISLSQYGDSLKFSSYRSLNYQSAYINIEVRLYNDSTGDLAAYTYGDKYDTDYLKVTGYADPPTGTYYAWSQHKWVEGTGHWTTMNLTTTDRSYVNPNE